MENYGFSLALPEYCPIFLDGLDFGGSNEVRSLWKIMVLVLHCLNIVRYTWDGLDFGGSSEVRLWKLGF